MFICLRSNTRDQVTVQVNVSGLLSCQHFRTFWISWSNGDIRIGTGIDAILDDKIQGASYLFIWCRYMYGIGGDVGEYLLIDWYDPNRISVKGLMLDTAHSYMGEFDVVSFTGN